MQIKIFTPPPQKKNGTSLRMYENIRAPPPLGSVHNCYKTSQQQQQQHLTLYIPGNPKCVLCQTVIVIILLPKVLGAH